MKSKSKAATETKEEIKTHAETNKWTLEEDSKLLQLALTHGDNFKKISKSMPRRSLNDCVERFAELKERERQQEMKDQEGKKGNWTLEEDQQLKDWVIVG